jgi:hypothetical protein
MAIHFYLVADFGSDDTAARTFLNWMCERVKPVEVRGRSVVLNKPVLDRFSYGTWQVSVFPQNVERNYRSAGSYDPAVHLDDDQFEELTAALYERLRGSPGCGVATVGWERDWISVKELSSDWLPELQAGLSFGLVVERRFVSRLPSPHWRRFDDLHEWIPEPLKRGPT